MNIYRFKLTHSLSHAHLTWFGMHCNTNPSVMLLILHEIGREHIPSLRESDSLTISCQLQHSQLCAESEFQIRTLSVSCRITNTLQHAPLFRVAVHSCVLQCLAVFGSMVQ